MISKFSGPEAPPKGIDHREERRTAVKHALITTLRDPIDAEVFRSREGIVKVVAQIAVGFDNINRADANKHKIRSRTRQTRTLTGSCLAEFAFFMMGTLARRMYASEEPYGAETKLAFVASGPTPLSWRRGHGQGHRHHRHRTHRLGR